MLHLQKNSLYLALTTVLLSTAITACNDNNTDTNQPTLNIHQTKSTAVVKNSQFTISGKVNDDTEIKSVVVNLHGKSYPATVQKNGNYTAKVPLQPNNNEYQVIATDLSGNQNIVKGSVFLDKTAPSITPVNSATDIVTQSTQANLSGNVTDNQKVASITLKVNNKDMPISLTDGKYSAKITLAAGSNSYSLIATDSAGNQQELKGSYHLGSRVAAANSHSGAVVNGKLYTWGRNNYGQTGLGFTSRMRTSSTHPKVPTLVKTAPNNIASIAFNQNHSYILDTNGAVWSFGYDKYGQLGRGNNGKDKCVRTDDCRLSIAKVNNLSNIKVIATGYAHTLALKSDGTVWAMGSNDNGQLGNGNSTNQSEPVQVKWADNSGVGKIIQIATGASSSFAIDDKGQVWAWGSNGYGNLGNGKICDRYKGCKIDINATPAKVTMPNSVKIKSITSGRDHILALTDDGKVYAWGLNFSSQVGYNGVKYNGKKEAWSENVLTPKQLPFFNKNPAQEVYANGNTSYALLAGGKVYPWGMWGEQVKGQRFPDYNDLDEPSDKLASLTNITDLAVGALHQVAMRKDSKVFSWGWNFESSLGGGDTATNFWMYHVPLALTFK